LILALSAVASATFLRQAIPTKNYENPWTADKDNGKCHDDEKIGYKKFEDHIWAMCMPIRNHGDSEACPKPPKFDTSLLDAFPVDLKPLNSYQRGCVVECSESKHGDCPVEASCLDAPTHLKTEMISKICYYKKHTPLPPHPILPVATEYYEDPFIVDSVKGKCHKDEKVHTHMIDGKMYGQCMPYLKGDTASCPEPPGFFSLNLSAYDTSTDELNYYCSVECTGSSGHSCPKGGECKTAPKDLANDKIKNVCVYEQPPAPVKPEVVTLSQNIPT